MTDRGELSLIEIGEEVVRERLRAIQTEAPNPEAEQ